VARTNRAVRLNSRRRHGPWQNADRPGLPQNGQGRVGVECAGQTQGQARQPTRGESHCAAEDLGHSAGLAARPNMEDNDLVFTTYEIVARECNSVDKAGNEIPCYSPLAKIKWRRIILGIYFFLQNIFF